MSESHRYERPRAIGDPSTMVKLANRVWAIPDTHRARIFQTSKSSSAIVPH